MNENETLKIFAEDYNDSADLVDKGITRTAKPKVLIICSTDFKEIEDKTKQILT